MNDLQEKIETMVRDFCTISFNIKSEVRKRLNELVDEAYSQALKDAEKIRENFIPKSQVERVLEKMKETGTVHGLGTEYIRMDAYNTALGDIRRELLGDK